MRGHQGAAAVAVLDLWRDRAPRQPRVPVIELLDEATAGAVPGRNLQLLRPDPDAIDPWFLAGFLRGTANHRQASSYASTAARLDARRRPDSSGTGSSSARSPHSRTPCGQRDGSAGSW